MANGATYNSRMLRRDRLIALGLCLLTSGATCIPYLMAWRLAPPGWSFSGFLLNPVDGFSYLAKMREGAQGAWLFYLPYAAQPGPGAFLFVYYLGLGHLAQALHLPSLIVYHAARLVGGALMYWMAYWFYELALADRGVRWTAFLLTLLGSGLGWLGVLFGANPSDLTIPESVPFLSAYANAHFSLAAAALLGAVIAVTGWIRQPGRRLAMAVASGLVMGIVLPFAVVSAAAVLGLWVLWETIRAARASGWHLALSETRGQWLALAACLVAGVPWGVYDVGVTRTSAALAAWSRQNLTPSPPVGDYVIGFGLALILALIALLFARPTNSDAGRLMITWAVAGAVLLYAPLGVQRRLSLGLYFPLAGLAAMGLRRLLPARSSLGLAAAGVIALSIPSNLVVAAAGLTGVARHDSSITLADGEIHAYAWLEANLAPGEIVLAGPQTGNRLPALTSARVLYGHPFETPDAEEQLALVTQLFSWRGTDGEAIDRLRELGVGLVFFGPDERRIGEPHWITQLRVRFREGDYSVMEVPEP